MGKGTSTSTQSQTSSLSPYDPAAGPMNGILGSLGTVANNVGSSPTAGQTGAINKIQGDVSTLNPSIMSGASGLLNGGGATKYDPSISGNLGMLKNGIVGQTASGANIGQNPALKAQLDQTATDVTNQTNGAWAAAGRDGSPGNAMALGRGIAAAQAPIIAQQYNTDTGNALNAANTLYGAGNTTYGMLNGTQGTANSNIAAGANLGSTALNNDNASLAAELQRSGIPISQLTTLLGAVSPVAAQFGTQTGSSTGTQTMSPIQQMSMMMQGIGSMMPKGPISFGG